MLLGTTSEDDQPADCRMVVADHPPCCQKPGQVVVEVRLTGILQMSQHGVKIEISECEPP